MSSNHIADWNRWQADFNASRIPAIFFGLLPKIMKQRHLSQSWEIKLCKI